jgi:hypothetical protein
VCCVRARHYSACYCILQGADLVLVHCTMDRYMIEDLDIFDWNLTTSEMATLSAVAHHKPGPHSPPPAPAPGKLPSPNEERDFTIGILSVVVLLSSIIVATVLGRRQRRGRGSKMLQEHLDSNLDAGPDDHGPSRLRTV